MNQTPEQGTSSQGPSVKPGKVLKAPKRQHMTVDYEIKKKAEEKAEKRERAIAAWIERTYGPGARRIR